MHSLGGGINESQAVSQVALSEDARLKNLASQWELEDADDDDEEALRSPVLRHPKRGKHPLPCECIGQYGFEVAQG